MAILKEGCLVKAYVDTIQTEKVCRKPVRLTLALVEEGRWKRAELPTDKL